MRQPFYEPEDDTYLLYELLKKEFSTLPSDTHKSILEIGVGSGEIIATLENDFPQHKYFGVDINSDAVEYTKKRTKNALIKQGNLFEPFYEQSFDIIFFNTPYLPCEYGENIEDLNIKDRAIYGGNKGYETILEFLFSIRNFLNKEAKVFMLISTQSKPHVVEKYLYKNGFQWEIVERKKEFFEELLVYKIWENPAVEQLKEKGVSHLFYLSKGKHSIVLSGKYDNNEVACKIEKNNFVGKEGFFLEKLQEYWFVPKLYFYTQNYIVMEKINGEILYNMYEKYEKTQITTIINNIFEASQILDELGVQKFEMLNPYKHIFIQDDLFVKFIDFERMVYSKKPKNTTQFIEYLRRKQEKLKKVGIIIDNEKLEKIAKTYKLSQKKIRIEDIIE